MRKFKKYLFFLVVVSFSQLSGQTAFSSFNDTIILNAFKQGKDVYNCSAIAFIKATIGTFGADAVFKSGPVNEKNNSKCRQYVLRSGEVFNISIDQLNYSIQQNGFTATRCDSISLRIKQLADTCYAVMCRKLQLLNNISFEAAVQELNTGYITKDIAILLGLKFIAIASRKLKTPEKYRNIIVYNYYHAAYASEGVYDEANNISGLEKLKRFRIIHTGPACAESLYLCEIKGLEVTDLVPVKQE